MDLERRTADLLRSVRDDGDGGPPRLEDFGDLPLGDDMSGDTRKAWATPKTTPKAAGPQQSEGRRKRVRQRRQQNGNGNGTGGSSGPGGGGLGGGGGGLEKGMPPGKSKSYVDPDMLDDGSFASLITMSTAMPEEDDGDFGSGGYGGHSGDGDASRKRGGGRRRRRVRRVHVCTHCSCM